ncbi:MAG: Flp pilus assembly protein CpaB [Pseudorhodoplanes sp.]|nr:Flp pilus assembly protein CpaB [Pseudorhodoplanes sp.]
MRSSTIVMIAFAVVFGLLAVFIAQSWLNSQAEMRMKSLEANKKPIATRTIVVAGKSLRFGSELSGGALREIPWPEQAIPAGAFATIADLTKEGRRVVLSPIEANEPILGWKITGPGQRATLSAMLRDGLKAVTIRVNDVEGVAGFVLPGDYVDVALTRQNEKTAATSDVILQSARVLAIDQMADERSDKPSVVKAVTLEVDTVAAQKISLAASIGTMSLILRKAGEANAEFTRRISAADLSAPSAPVAKDIPVNTNVTTVSVTRAATRQDYSVPIEGKETVGQASGEVKSRRK